MKDILLEEANVEAVQHALNTFLKLQNFFPKDHFLFNEYSELSSNPNDNFILTEKDKKSTVDFIYSTISNLTKTHLENNIKELGKHPVFTSQNKNAYFKTFNTEKDFLNNFSTLAITVKNENFITFNDQKIFFSKDRVIDLRLLHSVKEQVSSLFARQLSALNNHAVFDTLIYQINNKTDNTEFLKNSGLDFIENKNFLQNKNELSDKYFTNIFKTLDHFDFNSEEQISITKGIYKFFESRYIKENQKDLLNTINARLEDLFSLPDVAVNYYLKNKEERIEGVNWSTFFSYATKEQTNDILSVLLSSELTTKESLDIANKKEFDIEMYQLFEDQNGVLGDLYRFIISPENRQNGHLSPIIEVVDRAVYNKMEFNKVEPIFATIDANQVEVKKENKNKQKNSLSMS